MFRVKRELHYFFKTWNINTTLHIEQTTNRRILMTYSKTILISILLLICNHQIKSDNYRAIDSLQNILTKNISQQQRISSLILIAELHLTDYKKSITFSLKALSIINSTNGEFQYLKAKCYNNLANRHKQKGDHKSIIYRKKAINIYKRLEDHVSAARSILYLGEDYRLLGKIDSIKYCIDQVQKKRNILKHRNILSLFNTLNGLYYSRIGNPRKALKFYLKTLSVDTIKEKTYSEILNHCNTLNNITSCYIKLNKNHMSLKYSLEALNIVKSTKLNIDLKAKILVNVGLSYHRSSNSSEAIKYFNQILDLKSKISDKNTIIAAYVSLSSIQHHKKKYTQALESIEHAEVLMNKYNLYNYQLNLKNNKAITLMSIGRLDEAHTYLLECIAACKAQKNDFKLQINYVSLLRFHLKKNNYLEAKELYSEILPKLTKRKMWQHAAYISNLMTKIADKKNQFTEYKQYLSTHNRYRDSLNTIRNSNKIKDLEIKYKTAEKSNQIKMLNLENRNHELRLNQAKQINNIMIISFSIFIILLIPLSYHIRHRNRIKIMQTQIDTENNECTRIAQELHDSVSGSLTQLKQVIDLEGDSSNISSQIDKISKDVRGISHKLNISSLVDQNIKDALSISLMLNQFPKNIDLQIQMAQDFEINIQNKKINLIRIIQELVNNSLKHANCSKITINLSQKYDIVKLEYLDNGIGYDLNSIKYGNGHHNIKSRVSLFNGNIFIDSCLGNGFFCEITV